MADDEGDDDAHPDELEALDFKVKTPYRTFFVAGVSMVILVGASIVGWGVYQYSSIPVVIGDGRSGTATKVYQGLFGLFGAGMFHLGWFGLGFGE